MAASSGKVGYGLTCSIGGTAIEELLSVSTPTTKLDAVEATFMTSDDTHRDFIAGLCDGGEITVECNYRPKATGQALINTNLQARTSASVVIVLPSTLGTWTQTCYVTSWGGTAT